MADYLVRQVIDKNVRTRLKKPQTLGKEGFRYKKFRIRFVPKEILQKNIFFAQKLETIVWLVANWYDVHPREVIYGRGHKQSKCRGIVVLCCAFCNIRPTHLDKWAKYNGLENTAWCFKGQYVAAQRIRDIAAKDAKFKLGLQNFIRLLGRRKLIDLRNLRTIEQNDPILAEVDFSDSANFWEQREYKALGYSDVVEEDDFD